MEQARRSAKARESNARREPTQSLPQVGDHRQKSRLERQGSSVSLTELSTPRTFWSSASGFQEEVPARRRGGQFQRLRERAARRASPSARGRRVEPS